MFSNNVWLCYGRKIMTIGIFTAVDTEALSFLSGGDAVKSRRGSFDFYSFKLGRHDAVLCCPPNVGEIAASAACQRLITDFGADVLFNFGVVGALTDDMSLLSTVLVRDVVHYGMDTSAIDPYPVGRYECFDDVAVPCDEKLLQLAQQATELPAVRCASADMFVADHVLKSSLNSEFGADICDMESAGVLFTCKFNNVPCLMVKCVSDSLIGGANEYEQNCVKAAADFFALAAVIADTLD